MDVGKFFHDHWTTLFDGILALIVVTIGTEVYRHFRNKRTPKPVQFGGGSSVVGSVATGQQGTKGTGHTIIVNAPVAGGLTVGDAVAGQPVVKNEVPSPPPAVVPKLSTVTAKDINEAILKATPFLRDATAESYVGQPIDWNCWFDSIVKGKRGRVTVSLRCEPGLTVLRCHGDVLLSEYPQLRVLREGTPVRIMGTVEGFSGPFNFLIKNAKLYY
ncbi:MAG: hypothetical protein ABSG14_04945 [Verrucomicrobiia bacterium]|jgi:hypothetical protein